VSAVLSGDHDIRVSKDELDTDNFRSDCALSRGSASAAMSPTHPQNAEAPIYPSLNTSVSEICGKESQGCQDKGYSGSPAYGIDGNTDVFGSNQITKAIVIDSKCNSLDLDGEGYQEHQSAFKSNSNGEAALSTSLVNQPALATVGESNSNVEAALSTSEGKVINSMSLKETFEGESKSSNEMDREPLNDDKAISEQTPNTVSLDAKMQQERQVGKGGEKELIQSTHISAKQLCESTSGEYAKELHDEVILESKQSQIQNENKTNEEPVSSYVAKGDSKSVILSEIGCSEVSAETCPKEDSCIQFISNAEKEMEIHPINRSGEELSVSIHECSKTDKKTCGRENENGSEVDLSQDNGKLQSCDLTTTVPRSNAEKKKKRKAEHTAMDQFDCNDFIRSPCERLRPRAGKIATTGKSGGDISQHKEENPVAKRTKRPPEASVPHKDKKVDVEKPHKDKEENPVAKRTRRPPEASVPHKDKKVDVKKPHKCDIDNCHMSFTTKADLQLHKRNLCPEKGCGKKKFRSHKYTLIHQRVHEDDRPFECPWKGCSKCFKWAWAMTEHIRVHTGEKPYQCKVEGCGLSFRFISDFSRHRRKTGHYV
jgi:hypothetical protein